jgi:hypothetical protein
MSFLQFVIIFVTTLNSSFWLNNYEPFVCKLLPPISGFLIYQYVTPAFFFITHRTYSLLIISCNILQSPDDHFPPSYASSSLLCT